MTPLDKTHHRTLWQKHPLHSRFRQYCDYNLGKQVHGTSIRWWVLSDRVTYSPSLQLFASLKLKIRHHYRSRERLLRPSYHGTLKMIHLDRPDARFQRWLNVEIRCLLLCLFFPAYLRELKSIVVLHRYPQIPATKEFFNFSENPIKYEVSQVNF